MIRTLPFHHLLPLATRCFATMSALRTPATPLVVILGATGTGKSELAVELATRFKGEVINADAMQMYKGLPIITNKIPLEEQHNITHHLLGHINLDEETWVVGVFKREASKIIREIRSRGRLPIVVGGTHYYTKALLFKETLVASSDELSTISPTHDNSVQHPILEDTTEAIRKRLQEVDPVMADRWHPKDRRKIRRSLEIFLTTGRRASDIYAEQHERKAEPLGEPLLFWVHAEDMTLKERLDRRVDKMIDAGLMDEIVAMNSYKRSKAETGSPLDTTKGIWQSIGFKEFQPYLESIDDNTDENELEKKRLECLENMKTATRGYAKSQKKWIAKQMIPLLKNDGNLDKLYVLDSTDATRYADQVTSKAVDLTKEFLAGNDMAEPASISDFAKEVLTAAEVKASTQDARCNKYCKICDATFVTEATWDIHIRGKAHKRKARQTQRLALVPVTEREVIEQTQDTPIQLVS